MTKVRYIRSTFLKSGTASTTQQSFNCVCLMNDCVCTFIPLLHKLHHIHHHWRLNCADTINILLSVPYPSSHHFSPICQDLSFNFLRTPFSFTTAYTYTYTHTHDRSLLRRSFYQPSLRNNRFKKWKESYQWCTW